MQTTEKVNLILATSERGTEIFPEEISVLEKKLNELKDEFRKISI